MEGDGNSESMEQKVFWGPLTVDEIKTYLSQTRAPEVIGRRASVCHAEPTRTVYSDSPTTDYLIKKHFFGKAESELEMSLASEYYTPNETLCFPNKSTKNNDNFIEKVSKVLDLSNSSTYTSAAECSNIKCHEKTHPTKDLEFRKTPNIPQKTDETNQQNNSSNYTGEGQYSKQEIDTIVVSSDDDDDDVFKLSAISDESVIIPDNIQNCSNSEVYVISDGDSSLEEGKEIKNELHEQLRRISLLINENCLDAPSSAKSRTSNASLTEEQQSSNNRLRTNANSLDNVTEKRRFKEIFPVETEEELNESSVEIATTTEVPNILIYDEDNINIEFNRSKSGSSEDLDQYETTDELNESSASSECGFNDTLEEIKLALKFGLDYVMPSTHDGATSSRDTTPRRSKNLTYETIDVETPLHGTVSKIPTPPKFNSNSKSSPVKTPTKQNFDFKMPFKPPVRNKTPDFKNVLSPVAVYIKNSPRVPTVQHVPSKSLTGKSLFQKHSLKTSNKENITQDLPSRIYKPAQRTFTSKERELKLPGNIQKHLASIPDIIKHTERIDKKPLNSASVAEELHSEDLTVHYSDNDSPNSSILVQDISIRAAKKAYIT